MLHGLDIQNIVLVDRLGLAPDDGLTVLTGETGAGKSILLDALGLATGGRADSGLVRKGSDEARVSALFDIPDDPKVIALLDEQGIAVDDGELALKRVLKADGKSRAYVNDQPVSIGFLRQLGELLVEVHGQHDDRGLLNAAGHRGLLDQFGKLEGRVARVRKAHDSLKKTQDALDQVDAALARAREDEEFDRHALEELESMNVVLGEEDELADQRQLMMQGEKASGELDSLLSDLMDRHGPDAKLRGALRRLERLDDDLKVLLSPVLELFSAASDAATEGMTALENVRRDMDYDPRELEASEERLFALRALARKHRVRVDDLPRIREETAARLDGLMHSQDERNTLIKQLASDEKTFHDAVKALSKARLATATELDKHVMAELPSLKLEKARFRTALLAHDTANWGADGGERVEFEISTNPGADFGALLKIASGGELARIILALKVSLARTGSAPTLVFDEVDKGIGGAVADAVGERLSRLSDSAQVLVITHSPQVAARGHCHWLVAKGDMNGVTLSDVRVLADDERREEVARMLSGAEITDEARTAASSLIENAAQPQGIV